MKKVAIFAFIIVFIVSAMGYLYLTYKANYNTVSKENKQLESYYNEEILRIRFSDSYK